MKEVVRRIVPKFLWEKFRELRIARSVKRYRRRVVEHLYCGYPLKVTLADGIGESWYDKDWENLEEIDLLASGNLRPGATVFDLGAHQCVVAIIMAKIVGQSGRVIAVEGTKHNCEVAAENLRLNNIRNVTLHHAVIAEKEGQIRFCEGLNGSVSKEGVGQMIEAMTIDSLASKYGAPDVIFIDIEGFELNALNGASNVFKTICDWFIEVHVGCGLEEYGGNVDGVINRFPSPRYDCYVWNLNADEKPQALGRTSQVFLNRFALVALDRGA